MIFLIYLMTEVADLGVGMQTVLIFFWRPRKTNLVGLKWSTIFFSTKLRTPPPPSLERKNFSSEHVDELA